MQQPLLVASDVDGTLIDNEGRPTARTQAAVARVIASGTPFVLVTGRPPRWIPPVAELFPGVRMAVCANGAVRYDLVEDRVVSAVTLEPAALAMLAEACAQVLPGAWLGVERVGRTASDNGEPLFLTEDGYRHAWSRSDHVAVPREVLFDRPAIKLLVRHPGMTSDEMAATLAPQVGDAVALTFSTPNGLVEVAPSGVTKASGLAQVAEEAGLAQEDVIAFGDMPNDIPMLDWAGHGVAMGNGHADVLSVADEVTSSTTEDGVAMVLERWF